MIQYALNHSKTIYFTSCSITNDGTQIPLSQCIACNQENNQISYLEPWNYLLAAYLYGAALILVVYYLLRNIMSRRAIAIKLLPYGIYVTHLKGGKRTWLLTFATLCSYLIYIGKNQIDENSQTVSMALNNGIPCNITLSSGVSQISQLEANAYPYRNVTDLIQFFVLGIAPYLGTFILVGNHLYSSYTELNISEIIKRHNGDQLLNVKYKILAKDLDKLLHRDVRWGALYLVRYAPLLTGWKDKEVGQRLIEVIQEKITIMSIDTKVSSIWND